MTFVGKVLVVVQVVLSLCFMAFAGAVFTVQSNWREKYEKSQTEVKRLQDESNTLATRFDDFRSKAAKLVLGQEAQANEIETRLNNTQAYGLEAQLATARSEVVSKEAQIQSLISDVENYKKERDTAQAERDVANQEAAARATEAQAQRERNAKLYASLEDTIKQLRTAEDDAFNANRTVEELTAKYEERSQQLTDANEIIRRNEYDRGVLAERTPKPPPVVNGIVKEIRENLTGSTKLVQISLGSDDGMQVGHTLIVYRPAQKNNGRPKYLGKIELVRVTADQAVGTVIDSDKNGVIERNDNVTTQLF